MDAEAKAIQKGRGVMSTDVARHGKDAQGVSTQERMVKHEIGRCRYAQTESAEIIY